jgi:hypothetical protein
MNFIHVVSKSSNKKPDYAESAVRQSKRALISLILAMSSQSFGLDTLNRAKKEILNVKKQITDPSKSKLYIDSGGYSIINGDVAPSNISRFIDCYVNYLETEYKNFDFIFSLDIPISLGYSSFNTKQNIYDFNKKSLTESIKAIEKYPSLKDKFIFIYQFKMKSQYLIWKQLFDELDIKKYVNCFGLGGMVGLRGLLRNFEETDDIKFSPFIALAYKCLLDYISSKKFDKEFRLHNLGIYIKHDRFELQLLERLFKRYSNYQIPIKITYDSINYLRTAQLKSRDLEIYSFDNDELTYYDNIQVVPDNIIRQIYYNNEYYTAILQELDILKNNHSQKLNNIDCFTPLNIYSNIKLDEFFGYIIDKYEIANAFFQATDFQHFLRLTNPIITNLAIIFPNIFTSRLTTCIKENLRITYIFHKFFINRPGNESLMYEKLDELIFQFIAKIAFPFDLN